MEMCSRNEDRTPSEGQRNYGSPFCDTRLKSRVSRLSFPARCVGGNNVGKSIAMSVVCGLAALIATDEAASVGSNGGLLKNPSYPPFLLSPPMDTRSTFPSSIISPRPVSPHAPAAAPPKELLGKSIVVSWFEFRYRDERRGWLVNPTIAMYVSTAGRTFTKLLLVLGNRRGGFAGGGYHSATSAEQGPGERRAPGAKIGSNKFAGHALIITSQFESGTRRVVVDFAGGLTSCQARVAYGNESGHSTMRFRSRFSGEIVEVRAIEVSGITCAVKDGNVFTES
jgi:hypothetical protein